MHHRALRVAKLVKLELGKIIARDFDPEGALLTITHVEVAEDLERAAVFVSILPEEAAARTLARLTKAAGSLQYALTKKLNIMPMPRITFAIDEGERNAAAVEKRLLEKEGL
ncbi:MAG: 30S ribosome-binding factor RbfA [Candidatus Liptonbacteria bacterium]|nr:30S ribosome-binding factor RbfA [Candidatus Liptonbacteria bacterium]